MSNIKSNIKEYNPANDLLSDDDDFLNEEDEMQYVLRPRIISRQTPQNLPPKISKPPPLLPRQDQLPRLIPVVDQPPPYLSLPSKPKGGSKTRRLKGRRRRVTIKGRKNYQRRRRSISKRR